MTPEQRQEILGAIGRGESTKSISDRFKVSCPTVSKMRQALARSERYHHGVIRSRPCGLGPSVLVELIIALHDGMPEAEAARVFEFPYGEVVRLCHVLEDCEGVDLDAIGSFLRPNRSFTARVLSDEERVRFFERNALPLDLIGGGEKPPQSRGVPAFTAERNRQRWLRERIRTLYLEGVLTRAISARLDVNATTVAKSTRELPARLNGKLRGPRRARSNGAEHHVEQEHISSAAE